MNLALKQRWLKKFQRKKQSADDGFKAILPDDSNDLSSHNHGDFITYDTPSKNHAQHTNHTSNPSYSFNINHTNSTISSIEIPANTSTDDPDFEMLYQYFRNIIQESKECVSREGGTAGKQNVLNHLRALKSIYAKFFLTVTDRISELETDVKVTGRILRELNDQLGRLSQYLEAYRYVWRHGTLDDVRLGALLKVYVNVLREKDSIIGVQCEEKRQLIREYGRRERSMMFALSSTLETISYMRHEIDKVGTESTRFVW